MIRRLLSFIVVLAFTFHLAAEPATIPDGYRTVEKAITAKINASSASREHTGYLGVTVVRNDKGLPVVDDVQPDSPAAKAGLKKGDVFTQVGEQAVKTPLAFREWLQSRRPGESVKFALLRDDNPISVSTTLAAVSRPLKIGGTGGAPRVFLGLELGQAKEGEGVKVDSVLANSPAATAGLKVGDRVFKINGKELPRATALADLLGEKKPGDVLALLVKRDGKDIDLKATLGAERIRKGGGGGAASGFISLWKGDAFRVAVICVEFSDVKHNPKIAAPVDIENAFFSSGKYTDKNASGQPVHGSLNDYIREVSSGSLKLDGSVFPWVEVAKKRSEYIQGFGTSNKTVLLTDALDKLLARDGKDALKNFDGLLFIYAGERYQTNRGAIYYPHAGTMTHQQNRHIYFLGAEGGKNLTPIGGFAKEMAQVLGLPDLAARTENIGSEGLGPWCALSNPFTTARPQHLSAWAKEKLGWVKPAVIDPTVKQKLVLAPIEDSPKECFKVLVRPDGSEYFLLENRKKKGFDADLPGEGLLIWRVVNDRPILEESHGIEGPTGPTVHLTAVPFPSQANNSFTPDTTPSSRSPHGGGLPVHITEIRRLPDGNIAFQIGYVYR